MATATQGDGDAGRRIDGKEEIRMDALEKSVDTLVKALEKQTPGGVATKPRVGAAAGSSADVATCAQRTEVVREALEEAGNLDEDEIGAALESLDQSGSLGHVPMDMSFFGPSLEEKVAHHLRMRPCKGLTHKAFQQLHETIKALPQNVRVLLESKERDQPGDIVEDLLKSTADDVLDELKRTDLKAFGHLRPYLTSVGAAVQLLANTYYSQEEMKNLDMKTRQRLLIVMDLMASVVQYGTTQALEGMEERSRKGLLLVRSAGFLSRRRAEEVSRAGARDEKYKLPSNVLVPE